MISALRQPCKSTDLLSRKHSSGYWVAVIKAPNSKLYTASYDHATDKELAVRLADDFLESLNSSRGS